MRRRLLPSAAEVVAFQNTSDIGSFVAHFDMALLTTNTTVPEKTKEHA